MNSKSPLLHFTRRQLRWVKYRLWLYSPQHRQTFVENLQLLNDLLAQTSMHGRYWICYGLLLGWAREGNVLRHDARDADFGFFAEDEPKFLEAKEHLLRAGFVVDEIWRNHLGEIATYEFIKDESRFDFVIMKREQDVLNGSVGGYADGKLYDCVFCLPSHELEEFTFLDKSWMKPADHEGWLSAVYGKWRVPDPNYNYLEDDLSIIAKYHWVNKESWEKV